MTLLPYPRYTYYYDPLHKTTTLTTTSVSVGPFSTRYKLTKVDIAGIGIKPPAFKFYYKLSQGKYLLLIQNPVD